MEEYRWINVLKECRELNEEIGTIKENGRILERMKGLKRMEVMKRKEGLKIMEDWKRLEGLTRIEGLKSTWMERLKRIVRLKKKEERER